MKKLLFLGSSFKSLHFSPQLTAVVVAAGDKGLNKTCVAKNKPISIVDELALKYFVGRSMNQLVSYIEILNNFPRFDIAIPCLLKVNH